jgi:oxygen-independent coproporphyrinogen-3 oxidase
LPLGIYISVPFCRTKCSFCNFASGVFARPVFDKYVEQLCADIRTSRQVAEQLGGILESRVDSIYLGGGTPSVLEPSQLQRIFQAVHDSFEVEAAAEVTVECAPASITHQMLDALCRCGANRVSLGVQSFVDKECSSVGRLHTREITLADIAHLRAAGIGNISIDLIAGLPYQTEESWQFSLAEALASGVPHVSVYMLEVDEDSRLGNELLAGGGRYHAHFVPDADRTADLYLAACERLEAGGVRQYEISNFARPVTHGIGLRDSRHNLKYWTRKPYVGFGVDAHSMLRAAPELNATNIEAVRFATPDSLEQWSVISGQWPAHGGRDARSAQLLSSRTLIDRQAALEESFFLGLRLNRGISFEELQKQFGEDVLASYRPIIAELLDTSLLQEACDRLCLTPRGRLLSNEVFAWFLKDAECRTTIR